MLMIARRPNPRGRPSAMRARMRPHTRPLRAPRTSWAKMSIGRELGGSLGGVQEAVKGTLSAVGLAISPLTFFTAPHNVPLQFRRKERRGSMNEISPVAKAINILRHIAQQEAPVTLANLSRAAGADTAGAPHL